MSQRRREALRDLAERPGTEAEGIAARAALERMEAKEPTEADRWSNFRSHLRTGSMDDLADAVGPNTCDCGSKYPAFTKCANESEHLRVRVQITQRFPRGTRVYYNKWAYTANCAGTVVGYSRGWSWVRVKFDHLKQSRAVPIYSALGWHLSTQPVDGETLKQSGLRGGMERFEDLSDPAR